MTATPNPWFIVKTLGREPDADEGWALVRVHDARVLSNWYLSDFSHMDAVGVWNGPVDHVFENIEIAQTVMRWRNQRENMKGATHGTTQEVGRRTETPAGS